MSNRLNNIDEKIFAFSCPEIQHDFDFRIGAYIQHANFLKNLEVLGVMSIHYELLNDGGLAHIWSTKDCNYDEAHELWHRKLNDPRLSPEYVELVDLRHTVTVEKTADAAERIRQLICENTNRLPRRMAIVATTRGTWELGKLWEAQSDKFGRRCMVFGEFHIACVWLGIEPEIPRHDENEPEVE